MFQPDVCNGCHNVLMISMNLSDIAILNIHGVDYHDLTEKSGTLQNVKNFYHIIMDKEIKISSYWY